MKTCFDGVLEILSSTFYSVIFLLVSWHEERWIFFSSMCESTFWFLQTVFKRRRLKEISVYHQHTVGVRGHALLWSGLCVGYGKIYNKCTMISASETQTLARICSWDISFKPKIQFRRSYFWKPGWHIPTQNFFECPQGFSHHVFRPHLNSTMGMRQSIYLVLFFLNWITKLLTGQFHLFFPLFFLL